MQRLEVSGAVRPLHGSLGVKGLRHWLTYLHKLTTWSRILLNKLITSQETKKLHEFDATRLFTAMFAMAVSCTRIIQPKFPLYFKIHFNIIFPYNPQSSEASFFFRFSNQTHLPLYLTPRALRVSLSLHLPAAAPPSKIWWSVQYYI
jgi:hypothetical protein